MMIIVLTDIHNVNLGETNICELPGRLLSSIFRYIPIDSSALAVMLTCKKFHAVAKDHMFNHRRQLCITTQVNEQILDNFLRDHGSKVTSLYVSNNRSFQDRHLLTVIKSCPSLKRLDLSWTDVTSTALKELANLKVIRLTSLKLAGCRNFDNPALLAVLEKHGKSLLELDIAECRRLYKRDEFRPGKLAKACKSLQELSVGHVVKSFKTRGIHDDDILHFIHRGRAIRKLNLQHCDVSDGTLKKICSSWHNVCWLNISYTSISDVVVREICTSFSKLEHLDVSHCPRLTDHALARIDKVSSTLVHLNLTECPDLAERGCPILTGLPRLRVLLLTGLYRLSVSGVIRILNYCPNLGYLDIVNTGLTRYNVDQFAEKTRHFKLFIYHGEHPHINMSSSKRICF